MEEHILWPGIGLGVWRTAPFHQRPWGPDHVAHGHAAAQGGSASGGVETCSLRSAFVPSCSSGCRAEVRDAWWRFPCQSAAGQGVTSVGGRGWGLAQSRVMARDVQGLELWCLRTGLEAWCRAWRLLLLALLGALSLPSRGCVMLRKSLRF